MEVDMSPPAVTARLKLLDQLWELSVNLMAAKRLEEPETGNSESPARDEIFVEDESRLIPELR